MNSEKLKKETRKTCLNIVIRTGDANNCCDNAACCYSDELPTCCGSTLNLCGITIYTGTAQSTLCCKPIETDCCENQKRFGQTGDKCCETNTVNEQKCC